MILTQSRPTSKGALCVQDYVCRTTIKEVITPMDVCKILESDFTESKGDNNAVPQDDLSFLDKMRQGINRREDGQYERLSSLLVVGE